MREAGGSRNQGTLMDEALAFLAGMFGARAVEVTAAALGFVNVILIVRRTIWNYPFGISMVILYAWIFYDYRLYAEAGLQVYFLVIQCFGLWWWLQGRGQDGRVVVLRAPAFELAACAAAACSVALGLGWVLASHTDADLPYWDATVAALSVVAQYLLARRYLESWPVWIVVDIIAIGIYVNKGLYPTAALYALFLGLAMTGLIVWSRAFARRVALA